MFKNPVLSRAPFSIRSSGLAQAIARAMISSIPPELMIEMFARVFASAPLIVKWDPQVFDKAILEVPGQQILDLALSCHKFCRESAGTLRTMICQYEARIADSPASNEYLRRVQDIILEDGHEAQVDLQMFPVLKTIVCRAGRVYSVSIPSSGSAMTSFPTSQTLVPYRNAVEAQLVSRMPAWLSDVMTNPNNKIDISVELMLDFDLPLTVQENSWDAGSEYPALKLSSRCRYHWKGGTISDICSYM
ncbi:hypothetical protein H2200_010090 [Cladophialophora chaetospira]|uniref:Uncharacterized protein n=1 Tax=Cladophialophora chaetospira TaxID=386627 RepID=A0AA38X259_9EURO|nr:hypothetical protein H2200_010090 [Cladophialophora chaetospira]